jgi:AcrR family transcriptional regulator
MFGKPGRPPEDVFLRRREIYMAVAPLIEKNGPKGITMRQAAASAHMSLGGIYHYFPSKRELVLFGVSPELFARSCADFHAQYGYSGGMRPIRRPYRYAVDGTSDDDDLPRKRVGSSPACAFPSKRSWT